MGINSIKLNSKYDSIRKKLITANKDNLHSNSDYNKFVGFYAKMVAEGLQLAEESATKDND